MKDLLTIIGGIIGSIGGTLGIVTWIKSFKKDNRNFNQQTYMNHLKHSYKKCFENVRCPETDNINMYYFWLVINNLKEFQKHNNKFKGLSVSSNFNDTFLYANVIKFDYWTVLNCFNQDEEVNNDHTIADYNEKKIHIQRLKPLFRDFYLSIFENID